MRPALQTLGHHGPMRASSVLRPLPVCGFADWLDGAVRRLDEAAQLGSQRPGLNVLAASEAARRLYEQLGFQVHSLQMSRPLSQPAS